MKMRYCQTVLESWKRCDVGWGNSSEEGVTSCWDEPLEENCHNIVNSEDILFCPKCGTALGSVGG